MHPTCWHTVNRSFLDLYFQIPQGALLTWRPRVSSEDFHVRQLHGFCVGLREYFFVPNGYAENVLGGDQTLFHLYSGPGSNRGEGFDKLVKGCFSVQASWYEDAFGLVQPNSRDPISHLGIIFVFVYLSLRIHKGFGLPQVEKKYSKKNSKKITALKKVLKKGDALFKVLKKVLIKLTKKKKCKKSTQKSSSK